MYAYDTERAIDIGIHISCRIVSMFSPLTQPIMASHLDPAQERNVRMRSTFKKRTFLLTTSLCV